MKVKVRKITKKNLDKRLSFLEEEKRKDLLDTINHLKTELYKAKMEENIRKSCIGGYVYGQSNNRFSTSKPSGLPEQFEVFYKRKWPDWLEP